ncbi:MAG: TonB-dependent receptor, partial [Proteobacteria bacterium]|nr:TonB-dependent receptor [Pseudomonadota bacterium]
MDLPGSVSVLTEEVIRSRGAQHLEDIVNAIPNVNFAAGTSRARFFQIRGIGERSQFVNPINPSVGFMIDDVDFSGAGTLATMVDVDQVEVLRGPQGTRYGANALAGLINIKTNEPTKGTYATLSATTATYDSRSYSLVANLPLSDTLSSRWVLETHESDGYIRNDYLDRDDTNNRDELTGRARFAWQASDTWTVDLTLAGIDVDNGYDAFSLDNTRRTLSDEPGFDRQNSNYVSLKSRWQLDRVDVTLLLNQSASEMDYGYDEDWTYTGIHPFGYTSTDYYLRERDTRSAEIRLGSTDSSRRFGDSTEWTVGIYLLTSAEDLQRVYTFQPADFFSEYDFDTRAVFAQLDTRLNDRLMLGTGIRFEQRSTTYSDSEKLRFTPDDSLWGGVVSLEYTLSDQALAYASVSRGYKAGGFNTDGSLAADLREFDEEYMIEYELGIKAAFPARQLDLQLALFYDQRHDQQVKSSVVRPRADGSTEFIDFFGNAAEGTNRGLEIDIRWYFAESWWLTASAGYLDATFDQYVNEFGEDLSGRDQAQAPGYMYNLALNYAEGPWFVTVSTDGKDAFYFSDRHAVQSENYSLLHLSAGYATDNWEVRLWGRNLTDKDYYTRAFGSFGNDPRKLYVTEPYYQYGEPRVGGLTVSWTIGQK